MPTLVETQNARAAEIMQERGLYARELSLRSESVNEKERSFRAVVSTEVRAAVMDYRTWDVVDEILVARGGEFPDHMPLLPNHQRYDVLDVIGSAVDFEFMSNPARWEGRGIVANPVGEQDEVERIWQRVAEGHLRAVSIGYTVLDSVDIPAGRSAEVNGTKYEAGERTLRISTKWRAHELSLTPIGADEFALIRSKHNELKPTNPTRGIFR